LCVTHYTAHALWVPCMQDKRQSNHKDVCIQSDAESTCDTERACNCSVFVNLPSSFSWLSLVLACTNFISVACLHDRSRSPFWNCIACLLGEWVKQRATLFLSLAPSLGVYACHSKNNPMSFAGSTNIRSPSVEHQTAIGIPIPLPLFFRVGLSSGAYLMLSCFSSPKTSIVSLNEKRSQTTQARSKSEHTERIKTICGGETCKSDPSKQSCSALLLCFALLSDEKEKKRKRSTVHRASLSLSQNTRSKNDEEHEGFCPSFNHSFSPFFTTHSHPRRSSCLHRSMHLLRRQQRRHPRWRYGGMHDEHCGGRRPRGRRRV